MLSATMLFALIVCFIIMEFGLGRILEFLNMSSLDERIPDEMRDYYGEKKYAKSQEYAKANSQIELVSSIASTGAILLVLFVGGFAWLDKFVRQFSDHDIAVGLLFFGIIFVVSDILSLPFRLYQVFVIENRFGFNKMGLQTFFVDKFKGVLLAVLFGGGLLATLIWIYQMMGNSFWWIAWLTVSAVSLFLASFYTSIFVPLFNQLAPLPEGNLRSQIETYAGSVSFPLDNIYVMDGSKRSAKANAYFSGLAGKKSIVLYDTLIEQHAEEELVAVLAHEVGHYKRNHVLKSMLISILQMGLIFFILGQLLGNELLASALGAEKSSFHLGILVFSFLFSPISLVTGVLLNLYSRKNEYEADAFAKETYGAEHLAVALKKLSSNNLSNLNPHPLFVFFYYSHPPLLDRLAALKRG